MKMNASFYIPRLTLVLVFAGFLSQASAQYDGWKHSGSTYLVTDSAGADLPASAVEKNFPLLIRLNKEYFDFSEAKPQGEDIRFSSKGKPLAYQIERWDEREASDIWVRSHHQRKRSADPDALGNEKAPARATASVFRTTRDLPRSGIW